MRRELLQKTVANRAPEQPTVVDRDDRGISVTVLWAQCVYTKWSASEEFEAAAKRRRKSAH